MFKKIFEDIINLLPDELLENVIFANVTKALKKELPEKINYNVSRIAVSDSIFLNLISLYPDLSDNFHVNDFSENLVNMMVFTQDGLIVLRIKDYNVYQKIQLIVTEFKPKQKEMTIIIKDNLTLVETIIKAEDDKIITEYEYNVNLYNRDGNKLKIDSEKEKDLHFSQVFHVPLEEARKYRLHFKENVLFLNESKFKGENSEIDAKTEDKLFSSPCKIDNLELFIREELEKEVAEILGEEKETSSPTGELDNIIREIKSVIGESEEVIISSELFIALQGYLFKINGDMLYNKGIIIKKVDGIYTLYYIHLEKDKAMGMSQILQEDDIKQILSNNIVNPNLDELKNFFGLGNILK